MITFANLRPYDIEGDLELSAGEVIVLHANERLGYVQIRASGNRFRVMDTRLGETEILKQEPTDTDGWCAIRTDKYKIADTGITWDGLINAIKVQAHADNTGVVKVSYGFERLK